MHGRFFICGTVIAGHDFPGEKFLARMDQNLTNPA